MRAYSSGHHRRDCAQFRLHLRLLSSRITNSRVGNLKRRDICSDRPTDFGPLQSLHLSTGDKELRFETAVGCRSSPIRPRRTARRFRLAVRLGLALLNPFVAVRDTQAEELYAGWSIITTRTPGSWIPRLQTCIFHRLTFHFQFEPKTPLLIGLRVLFYFRRVAARYFVPSGLQSSYLTDFAPSWTWALILSPDYRADAWTLWVLEILDTLKLRAHRRRDVDR